MQGGSSRPLRWPVAHECCGWWPMRGMQACWGAPLRMPSPDPHSLPLHWPAAKLAIPRLRLLPVACGYWEWLLLCPDLRPLLRCMQAGCWWNCGDGPDYMAELRNAVRQLRPCEDRKAVPHAPEGQQQPEDGAERIGVQGWDRRPAENPGLSVLGM